MDDEAPARRRFLLIGFAVTALASFGGLAAMVLIGIEKVKMGHGLATYRASWLVEFNWVGFLVLMAALVVALVGAGYLRHLEWRELRQLRERYREKGHDI